MIVEIIACGDLVQALEAHVLNLDFAAAIDKFVHPGRALHPQIDRHQVAEFDPAEQCQELVAAFRAIGEMDSVAARRLMAPMLESQLSLEGNRHFEAPGRTSWARTIQEVIGTLIGIERYFVTHSDESMGRQAARPGLHRQLRFFS